MRRRFMNYSMSIDYSNYLTIEAIEDVSVLFSLEVQWTTNGRNWETGKRVVANAGQLVSIKRNAIKGEIISTNWSEGAYNLRGNIMSLLFGDDAKGKTSMLGYNLSGLFQRSNVITVEKGFLPATTLSDGCYNGMFYGCTSLTTAPELPASTLASGCYKHMFNNCTNLTTAPELPATTLTTNCYQYMFYRCTKLNYIKMLATDISAIGCLHSWAVGVASTGTFIKNKNATWNVSGSDGVPRGWTIQKV